MEIDYQEIMELPEPSGGVDLAALGNICCVYQFLVDKFTRLLHGPRERKDCWMQQERFAFIAKRLAFNARALHRANYQFRQGEIFNFGLKVRRWVLSCAERRLKIRALIGEARIRIWEDKRRLFEAGHSEIAHTKKIEVSTAYPKQIANKRTEIGNWYGLPKFPKRLRQDGEKSEIKREKQGQHNKVQALNIGGMRRPNPVIVFWPDELIPDFNSVKDRPNIDKIGTCDHAANKDEEAVIFGGHAPKIGAPNAREGPD